MRRGDVVQLQNWGETWNGSLAVVECVDEFIYIRLISGHDPKIMLSYSGPKLAGFHEHNLKLLGHIELPPE